MRIASRLLLALGLALPPALPALAADDDTSHDLTYASIGFAHVSAPPSYANAATNLTGTLGFHPAGIDWVAAEFELGTTVSAGDVRRPAATPSNCGGVLQPPCPTADSSHDRFSLQHGGVFGVLRTPGRVYGIGRIGYQYINTSLPELDGRHSGVAWSAGAGLHYSSDISGVELLYTHVSNNVRYWGLSLSYGFGRSKKPLAAEKTDTP
ncbi:MAG: hypothetical protein E6R07_12560 [Nevskiaceae bacterium]|nr:MAG: hypothetical protein E6R07_12560 [Nevskiaceae bacterium]